jgi:hypothetical protein
LRAKRADAWPKALKTGRSCTMRSLQSRLLISTRQPGRAELALSAAMGNVRPTPNAGRRFASLLSGAPGTRALGKPDQFESGARRCIRGSSCAIDCARIPFMRSSRADLPHDRSHRDLALKTYWWLGAESNHRHADFQSAALPTELPSQGAGLYAGRLVSGKPTPVPLASRMCGPRSLPCPSL